MYGLVSEPVPFVTPKHEDPERLLTGWYTRTKSLATSPSSWVPEGAVPSAPVVVVVNNDGYTIERMIHGKTAPYNDIVAWHWADIPTALGVTNHLFFRAENYGDLDDAFVAAADHRDRMVLIEAVVPRLDIPDLLTNLVADLG